MVSELMKYGGIAAKMAALRAKQLNNGDYEQLLSKGSVSEFASYLKNNTSYSDIFQNINEKSLHRAEIEELLNIHFENLVKKVYVFLNGENRKFLEIIFLRQEIELLKDVLRKLNAGKSIGEYVGTGFFAKHFSIDPVKAFDVANKSELIEAVRGTKYEQLISKNISTKDNENNTFTMEMTLDMHYFISAWKMKDKVLGKTDRKLVTYMLGSEIDCLNIMWIYRCKRYYSMPKEYIYTNLIPIRYKLKKSDITEMVESEKLADMVERAANTGYKSLFVDLDKRFIEQNFAIYMFELYKGIMKKEPYSVAAVMAQLYFAEAEIKSITVAVECIRYGLPLEKSKELVRINK